MSAHPSSPRRRQFRRLGLILLAAVVLTGRSATAVEPRAPAGTCLSEAGHLVSHEGPGGAWHVPGKGDSLSSRDLLVALPGIRGELEPRANSVRVTLWGQLPGFSTFPGLESAIVLHDSRAYDLDFTLLRGRVVLVNRKASGSARVWVRLLNDAVELTLLEPESEAAVEIYSRWPRGVPFVREPRPADRPTTEVSILVLKGAAEVRAGKTQHRLSAPPGPASFSWDSVAGAAEGPERLEKLPRWANNGGAPRDWIMLLRAFPEMVARKGPSEAARQILETTRSEDEEAPRWYLLAILTQAALGETDRVVAALGDTSMEKRDAAVIGLRHWIGGTAGRDQQLYHLLNDHLGYTKAQAETVLQLLHSPFAADQPETYDTLIAYLRHPKLAIRHLAYWHLQRLVPEDQVVAYNAAAPEAERARAAADWKKKIPSGSLPQRDRKPRDDKP
jgi:hypothetical protein